MSDVVIRPKLGLTRSAAARESGLRSAGSLDRVAAMEVQRRGRGRESGGVALEYSL